jgi:UDP-2,4-diacetamido-2,4,6-trideoxy-beta-L-altropyranose hydrolase
MRIVFRTDSSTIIGTGHVMRCLALADKLKTSGTDIHFVCREHPGNLSDLICARPGVDIHRLPATPHAPIISGHSELGRLDHSDWLGADWKDDAVQTAAALSSMSEPVDWLVIDHYAIDAQWEAALRPQAHYIMAIDDLADRHHDCDVLLDQNFHHNLDKRYDSLIPSRCLRLLGPSYALLRPQFSEERAKPRTRDGSVRRVLIFFGGIDASNETSKALHAIKAMGASSFYVDVILGPTCPHTNRIRALCRDMFGVHLHINPGNVAELMSNADLAIGAIGATTWERCSVGLPTIMISQAMNQESSARALSDSGFSIYLGDSESVTVEMIAEAIAGLMRAPERVRALANACLELTDGNGVDRVMRALDTIPITLRPAQTEDCESLYKWRNAEQTLRYSHSTDTISPDTHKKWFHDTLKNPNRILFVGERDEQPIGVLRYDCQSVYCTVSVYLVPGQDGHGYGSRLLQAGHQWLQNHRREIKEVRAEILAANRASIAAFLQVGYRRQADIYIKNLE